MQPHMAWADEDQFKRLDLGPDVSYLSVMRLDTGEAFCAPLGSPEPWPADSGVEWVSLPR